MRYLHRVPDGFYAGSPMFPNEDLVGILECRVLVIRVAHREGFIWGRGGIKIAAFVVQ